MVTGHLFEKVVNGPAHHTLHHLYFTVNYGQVSSLNKRPSFFHPDLLAVLYVGRPRRRLISPATVRVRPYAGGQGTRRQKGRLTTAQNVLQPNAWVNMYNYFPLYSLGVVLEGGEGHCATYASFAVVN
jgi:hypothetical protein